MLEVTPTLSQKATPLDIAWTEGDPISMSFRVKDTDWTGMSYTAQVKHEPEASAPVVATLTIAATLDAGDTVFTITATAAEAADCHAGDRLYWDMQEVGGITRFGGRCFVGPQVTA